MKVQIVLRLLLLQGRLHKFEELSGTEDNKFANKGNEGVRSYKEVRLLDLWAPGFNKERGVEYSAA